MYSFTKNVLLSLVLLTAIFNSAVTFSSEEDFSFKVFTAGSIKKIIGDFPAKGSIEEVLDFQELLRWQDMRTEEDCLLADSQNHASLKAFFASNNGPVTEKEAKHLQRKLMKYSAEIGLNLILAKKLYKRERPYNANTDVKPCIALEKSSSYPSGHAAMARALALLISDIYPERREELMERANRAALNRVIGGVHHPSDVAAGIKLGDAIYQLIKKK